MLGRAPCRWQIGSPATARPLANEPFTPPKRRRPRLVASIPTFDPRLVSAQARLFGCPAPRKRIASSRSLVHTFVWCRGQHKRSTRRRRRARAAQTNEPQDATQAWRTTPTLVMMRRPC